MAIETDFEFIGVNLALDFANTWGGLPPESVSQDRLTDYSRLLVWALQASLINEEEAAIFLKSAEKSPKEANAVLERALRLREAIRDIFLALAKGEQAHPNDLDLLNQELGLAMAGAKIISQHDKFEWEWRREAGALDLMLGAVARSAATLLTSAELGLVRKCANVQCRWLFVDTTKNHRRQWCKTSGCGNVMRVRKHRERQSNK